MKIYNDAESMQVTNQIERILQIKEKVNYYDLRIEFFVNSADFPDRRMTRVLNFVILWEQYLRVEPFLIANGFEFKVTAKFN